MSSLSTHALDTTHGHPAAGMTVRLVTAAGELLAATKTNIDGRCPDLPVVQPGRYRIEFEVAAYYRQLGVILPEPPFLDIVRIDFGVADGNHYHVPILVSPFSFSTYRGS